MVDDLKERIDDLVKEYNSSLLPGDKRLILQEHDFLCRCMQCWYDYNGPERDKLYCPNIRPYEDYPSNEMLKRVADARELEIKKRQMTSELKELSNHDEHA